MFIDVETTGLDGQARLIEIGAIDISFDGMEVNFDTFETLINPGVLVSDKITEITGITNAELSSAPMEKVAYDTFTDWVKTASPGKCVAHNSSFDENKLKYNLQRLDYDLVLPPFECTMRMSKKYLTKPKNDKLKTLSEHYNFSNMQAHRALSDTEVCAFIYAKILLGEYE